MKKCMMDKNGKNCTIAENLCENGNLRENGIMDENVGEKVAWWLKSSKNWGQVAHGCLDVCIEELEPSFLGKAWP